MRAQPHILMYYGKAAQNNKIIHVHMASQLRIVGKNGVVANGAVMGQMHIGHDPVVVTNSRNTAVAG